MLLFIYISIGKKKKLKLGEPRETGMMTVKARAVMPYLKAACSATDLCPF